MYILTGTSCSGKTTIIDMLKEKGYNVVGEGARELIKENRGSKILPWINIGKFQEQLYIKQREKEKFNSNAFYDRSLVDVLAYCIVSNCNVPKGIVKDLWHSNYKKVFFLEKLPFIEDSERKDLEIRNKIDNTLLELYNLFGYSPIIVPAIPKKERFELILSKTF